jgi:hypothetical protein
MSDEVDDARWMMLREAVVVAHDGDGAALQGIVSRLVSHTPGDERPRTWIEWLAHRRVGQLIGRQATRGDLSQLAGYLEDRFMSLIKDVGIFETLQIMWNTAPPPKIQLTEIELLAAEAAALAVMSGNPEAELDGARVELEGWCRSAARG